MLLTQLPAKSQKTAPGSSHSLLVELDGLFTGDHVNASNGIQYIHKNFGRDSSISMLFLLDSLKYGLNEEDESDAHRIISQVIKSLVRWQGQKPAKVDGRWRKNAEEPGKIHHEAGPLKIDELSLASRWQEDDDKASDMLVYYGSIDATPLFVRLVGQYAQYLRSADPSGRRAYGLLVSRVPNYRGRELTVAEALVDAVTWICIQLASSNLGLLEYQRRPGQEQGLPNQTWKDSLTSYVHPDGRLVNTARPIASIEIQGLAYDALVHAAELFEQDPLLARAVRIGPPQTKNWRNWAQRLQASTLKNFWLADSKRFATAIDRHPQTAKPRQLLTPNSNELHLLNSDLFSELPEEQRRSYLMSLVRQTMSDDFLTDAGVRCRAKSAYRLIDFADYHGSWSVWPWESHWIALGLRKQGFNKLADEVDVRILNTFILSGDYFEYYLASPKNGETYYKFQPLAWSVGKKHHSLDTIAASTMPDKPQTWSVMAAIDIRAILSKARPQNGLDDRWVGDLQKEMLLKTKHIPLVNSGDQTRKMRDVSPVAIIDRVRGRAADERYHSLAGTPASVLLPAV